MTAITTVSGDQTEILRHIQTLHNGGRPYQADLTYSTGKFWTNPLLAKPVIRMDLFTQPSSSINVQGDTRQLPFLPRSLSSVVLDPPFIHAPGKTSIIGNRFGGYKSQQALRAMYFETINELAYTMAPGGLLVMKCQDIVESGKQVWNHLHIIKHAESRFFDLIDLFILIKKGQIVGHNHARQVHARRAHSYFLVFRNARGK